ncbi:hypothetical protein [Paenibacillus alkalitolerans]|uniref:hypothetical protein n=1 Tax=Paenibacillus alkalitolerans TaxID=2799335 RepID=UPI0018F58895|nr:hypothetical protein [Paenibacillus alkalitolerans]
MSVIKIKSEFFNHDAQAGGFFPETHANQGIKIEKFVGDTGQNYLIEGIRGTGKTHILKMINQWCLDNYQKNKVLPVYVSLAGVSEWIEKDMALFRMHLYANIVVTTVGVIENNKDKIDVKPSNGFTRAMKLISQMFGLSSDTSFENILSEIKNIHTALLNRLTYNSEHLLQKDSATTEQKISGRATLQPLQLTFDDLYKTIEENEVKFVGRSLAHENASSFIIQFFNQLKEILNHKYTLILLDECSEVSKDAQIEVFRLLKLIRGAFTQNPTENTAYFCATVYPTPVTYYPSKLRGDSFNFDCGHDAIMEYLHLDELSEEYLPFFQELTGKRYSKIHEKQYNANSYLEIFENERAFILAAYLSNGIVRRYIEILKHAYDNLCQRVGGAASADEKKISIRDIEEGVNVVVSNQILAQNKLLHEDFVVLDDIINRISRRNKKNETENKQKDKENKLPSNVYFTVSRSELERLGRALIQGAVHDKGKTRLKKYHKEGGVRGALLMLDLATAFYHGAIERTRAVEIFSNDLKQNAKSGYLWCQDFKLAE